MHVSLRYFPLTQSVLCWLNTKTIKIIMQRLKIFSLVTLIVASFHVLPQPADSSNVQAELRFAELAMSCVHKEFPNIIKHMMTGPEQVQTPRQLYPAFYGCFDWHSSVHGHWLLVRLLNTGNEQLDKQKIIDKLNISFTADNIKAELAYFNRANTGSSFERPYGLAWFLQLTSELRQSPLAQAKTWMKILKPLEQKIVENLSLWLPKLAYPIRVGEHSQTAFAFGLMLDWARVSQDQQFEQLLISRIKNYYLKDTNCPLSYEPSGQDFLSACIAEADLMRRVLPEDIYASWLTEFLPNIPHSITKHWLQPVSVADKTDGKLAHLDGLNLSRAWMLEGIANALPTQDKRRASIENAAQKHKQAGLDAVLKDLHYMGSHWLGSFATYLQTQRGINR